ncbi:MAG: hypothetical protein KC433_03565 [Anaerolineales bacterium]|nr:hypothetical protein [Anaerolineales bacterium]
MGCGTFRLNPSQVNTAVLRGSLDLRGTNITLKFPMGPTAVLNDLYDVNVVVYIV